MSHLVQEYAKSCGVKIGKPVVGGFFHPIPFKKYITLHNGSINSKNYSYWSEVVALIKPILEKKGINIIQITDKGQSRINGCDYFVESGVKHSSFVISRALAHVGVESVFCHLAAHHKVPVLAIYSHSNPKNNQPWKPDKSKTQILESPKTSPRYTYDPNEKSIDKIFPEVIAAKIFKALKFKNKIKRKTLFIGNRYLDECVDVVPVEPFRVKCEKINVRMDICHNEAVLQGIISNNFVEITLSQPIPDEILQSRRISYINYISDSFDVEFVKKVKSLGINMNLLCVSPENLANERLRLFDFDIVFHDIQKIAADNYGKLKDIQTNKIKTKSNKKIAIGEKVFSSYLEAIQSKELFFLDLEWMYLYTES